MYLNTVIADITSVEEGLIVHGVNCQGVMGSGIAKAIRVKWPRVYDEYQDYCEGKSSVDLLGTWQLVPISSNLGVINVFSQNQYGHDGHRYAKPDAIHHAIHHLFSVLQDTFFELPVCLAKIGCGLGGLSWEQEVKPMFEDICKEIQPSFSVNIYDIRK